MQLILKSGKEIEIIRYEENTTEISTTRSIIINPEVQKNLTLAELSEEELSAAHIKKTNGKEVALPPLVAESIHRSIDDYTDDYSILLYEK